MLHLTPLSFAYLVATAALFVVDLWSPATITALWQLLFAVYCLALLAEWLIFRQLPVAIQREVAEQFALGKSHQIYFTLTNNTGNPLALKLRQPIPQQIIAQEEVFEWRLKPGQSQSQALKLVPQTLGSVVLGPMYSRCLGRFNLAWWERSLLSDDGFLVAPATLSYKENAQPSALKQGQRKSQHMEGGIDILGLREYRPGDSLRLVDWKATARSRKTMVRQFAQEQQLECIILLDIGRHSSLQAGQLTRLHHFVNVAARLAQKALDNGDRVGLMTFAEQAIEIYPLARGTKAIIAIRDILARTYSAEQESNPLLAMTRALKMLSHRSLIVVLTDLYNEDNQGQLSKSVRLAASRHLPLIVGILDEALLALRNDSVDHWQGPYNVLAANESTKELERNVYQLKKLGAEVICALPDQLDQTLFNHYLQLKQRRRV